MGFFSDLKEDLSQAVSELMPEEKVKADEPMSLDDPELSLEEMLKNIDDFQLPEEMGAEAVQSELVQPEPEVQEAAAIEEAAAAFAAFQTAAATPEEPAMYGGPVAEAEPEMYGELMAEAEPEMYGEPVAEAEPEMYGEPVAEAEPEMYGEPVAEAEPEMYGEPVAEAEPEMYGEPVTEVYDEPETYGEPAYGELTGQDEPVSDAEPDELPEQIPAESPDAELMPEVQEEVIQNETIIEENKGGEEMDMEDMELERDNEVSDETSVITEGMTITGDLSTKGSIDVIGTVNGNIDALGKLNITGHVNGNSKAAEIYAESAKINGEIVSEGAVKIGASSVIIGNITATSAAIAGAVKGDIDVRGPVILDASAIVMGNIKSKSVQINNGAVIEGMCSQCYADVSPTTFFDEYKPEIIRKTKAKQGEQREK